MKWSQKRMTINIAKNDDWRKFAQGEIDTPEAVIILQQALFYYEILLDALNEKPPNIDNIKIMVKDVIRLLKEELQ